MNLIIAIIDTLSYDHVGANGNGWIETPNLDRLASESWCFDRCFASSFPTIPHRLDTVTGRYGGPFHAWMPLPYDWPTLPRALAEEGYATQLIHDTPHLVNGGHHFDWPFHGWTFVRGAEVDRPWVSAAVEWPPNWARDPLFDFADLDVNRIPMLRSYVAANRHREGEEDWNAARLFRTAREFLRENAPRDNFLLWVDCFDPHEPWDAPPDYVRKYDDAPGYDGRIDPRAFFVRNSDELTAPARDRIAALYAAKVSWMDHCFGTFLDGFYEMGLADDTALILTADHGTRVGEWDLFGKGGPIPEQVAHVPLFVRPPGGEHGRSDALVQPQDITVTLAALGGVEPPSEAQGQDLLALARSGGPGRREVAVTGGSADGWNGEGPLGPAVFGRDRWLQLALDPAASRLYAYGEQKDRAAEEPGTARELHSAAIAELAARGADPKVVRWLRSEGAGDRPARARFFDGSPKPKGYTQYWHRLYREE
ncbi:MAG: sulfatase [Candidatus Brocadiaceae bacterium]|jgi:arylsulfatase A-like enzyme